MDISKDIYITKDINCVLSSIIDSYDQVVVIVDENTKQYCLPKIEILHGMQLIEIRSGERNKNITTCNFIWQRMTDYHLTRKSVIINLGGGVIGDMGGFVASTYKRGIDFINIPTTLLAQVDASVGGKLGVDFKGLKNHIGIFKNPKNIIINTDFIVTLPKRELRSGYAEVIKHGAIYDDKYWDGIRSTPYDQKIDWQDIVKRSIAIKEDVVRRDPTEKGLRKILNFGHTVGHAIETKLMGTKDHLLHGEAIAIGMIIEGHISHQLSGLPISELFMLTNYIVDNFGFMEIPSLELLMPLIRHDKKNEGNGTYFSLLNRIGSGSWNWLVTEGQLTSAVKFYYSLNK